jgi:glutathione S-transferase
MSPHAWKVPIALEEMSLPYQVNHISLAVGAQKSPDYLKISPWGVVPTIVDEEVDDLVVIESGAILIYLAEKSGKLLPTSLAERSQVLQWLMFHTANMGPAQSVMDLLTYEIEKPIPEAVEFYRQRALGMYAVFDRQLAEHEYVAGQFSIADIAHWVYVGTHEWVGLAIDAFPNVERWLSTMAGRPGCCRGLDVPAPVTPDLLPAGEEFAKYRRYLEIVAAMKTR